MQKYIYLIFQILSEDMSYVYAMIINVTFNNADMNKRIIKFFCLKFLSLTLRNIVGDVGL